MFNVIENTVCICMLCRSTVFSNLFMSQQYIIYGLSFFKTIKWFTILLPQLHSQVTQVFVLGALVIDCHNMNAKQVSHIFIFALMLMSSNYYSPNLHITKKLYYRAREQKNCEESYYNCFN